MPLQFVASQIANNQISAAKMNLAAGQTFDFSSAAILVGTPSNSNEAASKSYVDSVAQGLYWKDPVEVATVANITLSGTQTIDNVSVVAGDRVLVRAQTDAKTNGIYVASADGWSRSDDMNAGSEFPGAAVFVLRGDTYADSGFVCTNDTDPTLGADNITFTQFTGTGAITAGDGLTKSGSTLSVDLVATTSGLTFTSGKLEIEDAGIKLEKMGWSYGYEEFTTTAQLTFTLTGVNQFSLPSDFVNGATIKVFRNGQLLKAEQGSGQPSDDAGYNITTAGSTDINIVIKNGSALTSGEVLQAHYISNN